MDSGTLSLPDGRIFTGEFSISYPEGSNLKFSSIPVKKSNTYPFTLTPHIFRGKISRKTDEEKKENSNEPEVWAAENLL